MLRFLARGGATPRTNPTSTFTLYYAAYGICALIIALDIKSAKRFLEKPFMLWVFATLMLFTWGMLVRTFNAPAGIEDYLFFREFGLKVNAIGFLLCCAIIFDDPATLRITKRAVVVATLAGVVLNIYDFIFPGTLGTVPGRAAGLYGDPNVSGMSLVFGCVIGLSAIRRRCWQEAFVLVTFIGVLVTFSRESILAFGCVVVAESLAGRLRLFRLAIVGGVVIALFVAFNIGHSLLGEKIASSDLWPRLTSQFLSDASARQRASLAERALSAFEEAPLLGQGFGTTIFWGGLGPHNFYLSLLADHGIIAIFLIPALLLSIGRKSWDFYGFAAVFLVWCLFSHNILDEASSLVFLAIGAAEPQASQVAYDPKPASLAYGR